MMALELVGRVLAGLVARQVEGRFFGAQRPSFPVGTQPAVQRPSGTVAVAAVRVHIAHFDGSERRATPPAGAPVHLHRLVATRTAWPARQGSLQPLVHERLQQLLPELLDEGSQLLLDVEQVGK